MPVCLPPTLHKVECICFPRCGHHLVERMLRRYYGEWFHYCEPYIDPANSFENNPATNFQKNHDFDLSTGVQPDRRYLVLIRDPREALISWFRLKARKGEIEYTYRAWEAFAGPAWTYWAGFFNKWVVRPMPNRLIVDYGELLAHAEATLGQIVELMSQRPACVDTCRQIVEAERVEPKSVPELFPFGESEGLEVPCLR